jgi:hypothetical protein
LKGSSDSLTDEESETFIARFPIDALGGHVRRS